jgi:hypothetical protein
MNAPFQLNRTRLCAGWIGILLSAVAPGFSQTNLSQGLASIATLGRSAKGIPFRDVVLATTGYRILNFDTNDPAHVELRMKLNSAAELALARAATNGLAAERANEAGNHMETFVRAALKDCGLGARVPVTAGGDAQAVGYPDIEITGKTPCYIELKTYNAATVNTTQRSFYFSPSANPKITRDALHLLMAFELERTNRAGRTSFVPKRWKLLTLEYLYVDLKFEFNQSNRGLYGIGAQDALLGESGAHSKAK